MNPKTKKNIAREGLVIVEITLIAIVCCFVSGCSSLVREERDRALDEKFAEGKIDKIQYLTSKNKLKQEEAMVTSRHEEAK